MFSTELRRAREREHCVIIVIVREKLSESSLGPSTAEMIVSHAFRKADNFSSQTDLLVIKLTIMCQRSCLVFVHAFAQKSGFTKGLAFE